MPGLTNGKREVIVKYWGLMRAQMIVLPEIDSENISNALILGVEKRPGVADWWWSRASDEGHKLA